MNTEKAIYLKGLNGIRAIAALAVVLSHVNGSLSLFGFKNLHGLDLAGYGVTMFFVLSGYLISYLLFLEREKGEVNIRKFYIRRILRIWPLYFFYLAISVVIAAYTTSEVGANLLYYTFFLANVPFILSANSIYLVAHYWSLAVEEQFYLFWPLLFRRNINFIKKLVLYFTVIYFGFRLAAWGIERVFDYSLFYTIASVNRFDCMAIGALGAIIVRYYPAWCKYFYHYLAQVMALTVFALTTVNMYHIASVIDSAIVSVMTVILIVNVSTNPKSLVSLENRVFNFLGKISYGIYVWHPLVIFLFTFVLKDLQVPAGMSLAVIYVLTISTTILLAYLSYEHLEKRFLVAKQKYSVVPSRNEQLSAEPGQAGTGKVMPDLEKVVPVIQQNRYE